MTSDGNINKCNGILVYLYFVMFRNNFTNWIMFNDIDVKVFCSKLTQSLFQYINGCCGIFRENIKIWNFFQLDSHIGRHILCIHANCVSTKKHATLMYKYISYGIVYFTFFCMICHFPLKVNSLALFWIERIIFIDERKSFHDFFPTTNISGWP